ncbi:MAG: putative signal transduction histidine kinase [Streptosporangiaceae bacterium]|jgi:signal transduction histidine kinase|nr:putative signal transduction histidine kinase [Streptosporangiaceae bacterium]
MADTAQRADRPDSLGRPAAGRVCAGVCRGLSEHLGLDVVIVRLAFLLLMVAGGLGLAAYIALWVLVPQDGEPAGPRDWPQLAAYGALGAGLSLATWASGAVQVALWPVVVCGVGAAILWQQADPDQRRRWVRTTTIPLREMWLRSLLGALLVMAGIGAYVAQRVGADEARQVLIATAAVLAGVAVIATPWVLRLWRDLDTERRERIRSQERAEFAAHVHDSVLHTLTLIQRNAADPREVQRLARSQERELRGWLYTPSADPDQTLAAAVRRLAGEVEDDHGVPIETVCVGDCTLDGRLAAMLQAAREAMVNAAKYAEAPSVSVFTEVEGDEVALFVRDRGRGFDLDAIPSDRMGVRGSIIGRMRRYGGKATVRTAPGEGTEVRLEMRRA